MTFLRFGILLSRSYPRSRTKQAKGMKNSSNHNLPDSRRRDLDEKFEELLKKDSPEGRTLWVSVKRTLQQFHLTGSYTEACILIEVYLRAVKASEQGKTIDNLLAWCRQTSYNYIRELSRTQLRSQPIDNIQLEAKPNIVTDEMIDDDLLAIRLAFKKLSPEEQKLISLFVVEQLPWKEIRRLLLQGGAEDRKEATLRKAKERALKRLRENYHSIKSNKAEVAEA